MDVELYESTNEILRAAQEKMTISIERNLIAGSQFTSIFNTALPREEDVCTLL